MGWLPETCEGCIFRGLVYQGRYVCEYILKTGKMRGCKVNDCEINKGGATALPIKSIRYIYGNRHHKNSKS